MDIVGSGKVQSHIEILKKTNNGFGPLYLIMMTFRIHFLDNFLKRAYESPSTPIVIEGRCVSFPLLSVLLLFLDDPGSDLFL